MAHHLSIDLINLLYMLLKVKAALIPFTSALLVICSLIAVLTSCSSYGSFTLLGNEVESSCL